MTTTAEATMAKRNDVSVKMDADVVEECRLAATLARKTLAEYLSESMRATAARDIDEGIAKRGKPAPKGKKS